MIKISSNTIMILQKDSTLEPFESSEISAGIIGACLRAGESDTWIGDDIARSVEFALLSREKHLLTVRELSDMIVRSLEDAGYAKAAEEYRKKTAPVVTDAVTVTPGNIEEILAGNLALNSEKCGYLSGKVEKALRILGFDKVSPRLIQELARQYRDAEGHLPVEMARHTRKNKQPDGTILSRFALEERLSPGTKCFFEKKILAFHNVSILFPMLRFDLNLSLFADDAGLCPPVTELAFWNSSSALARALEDAEKTAETLVKENLLKSGESVPETIPFSMDVTDTLAFASAYMNCPERYAPEYVPQLLEPFSVSLKKQPFKITCL